MFFKLFQILQEPYFFNDICQKQFWSYAAITHVVFLINRIPSPTLNNKSCYFIIHNRLPDLLSLKVFTSLAYASTLQNYRTKLSCRARKCVFLGYKPDMKGVELVNIIGGNLYLKVRSEVCISCLLVLLPVSDSAF
jgi:hypothetical protein